MINLWLKFKGLESTVAAVARYMLRNDMSAQDVLAEYDRWLAERLAEMEPVGAPRAGRRRQGAAPAPRTPNRALRTHKAGDYAVLPAACPACGGDVEMYQLCHLASPIWRTQLACMADGCAWHGKSKLPIDALLAAGAKNIENNVIGG